jgi:hypothetical protein
VAINTLTFVKGKEVGKAAGEIQTLTQLPSQFSLKVAPFLHKDSETVSVSNSSAKSAKFA